MISEKLKVGIAGYGVVGNRRRQFIDANPAMRTVAVSDVRFKDKGQFPDGVRYHPDYRMLLDEELDALFVCLPNYLAADATIGGLERGMHVFCEKPPGRDVADIERVMAVERSMPGLRLKYGFNHRYHDSVRRVISIIANKELGDVVNLRGVYGKSKILSFSSGWRSERRYAGGGILLDQGIHMVDLMRLFCGQFVEIKSFISNQFWKHDVEDNAYALLRDEAGRVAMLHSTATQWQHRFNLEIALTGGFLELSGILSGSMSYGEECLTLGRRDESDFGTLQCETIKYLEDNSWRDEINEFVDCILTGKAPVHGKSSDALETMRLVYAIYHADEAWRRQSGATPPGQP